MLSNGTGPRSSGEIRMRWRGGAEAWADPHTLLTRLRTILHGPDYQPPVLPAVALQLLDLSRAPDVPIHKIKSLIRTEPLVAAKLLRLARTAHYSRGTPIDSLDDAIARLGLRTLGDLFLREAMTTRVFKAPGFQEPMAQIRDHSIAVAELSSCFAERCGITSDRAFMCGLLHDVGKVAAILALVDLGRGVELPDYEVVRDVILQIHEEAAVVLSEAWKLPHEVHQVLADHHSAAAAGRDPLVAVVCLADGLVGNALGINDEESQAQLGIAVEALGLGPSDVAAMVELAAGLNPESNRGGAANSNRG